MNPASLRANCVNIHPLIYSPIKPFMFQPNQLQTVNEIIGLMQVYCVSLLEKKHCSEMLSKAQQQ